MDFGPVLIRQRHPVERYSKTRFSSVWLFHADDDDDDDDDDDNDDMFLLCADLLPHRNGNPIRSVCTPIAMNSFFTC